MRGKELTASRDGRHKILNYFSFLQNIRIFLLARMPTGSLSVSFPSLYVLVASKEAWVVEVWDSSREKGGWNPRFSGSFYD